MARYVWYEKDASANLMWIKNATSTPIIWNIKAQSESLVESVLKSLIHWDAIHMLAVAEYNVTYPAEIQYAFFPLLPTVMLLLEKTICFLNFNPLVVRAFFGLLFTNISFVFSAVFLHKLILMLTKNKTLAYLSFLLFCFQPGSAIMSSIYTESPFCMFAFLGMLMYEQGYYFYSCLSFTCCCALRSNGMILSGFFAYRFLFFEKRIRYFIYALVVGSPFILFQIYAYFKFCTINSRPWCSQFIPAIYPFVQERYWKVGFLKFLKWEHIDNILIATPTYIHGISQLFLLSKSPFWYWDWRCRLVPYVVMQIFMMLYIGLAAQINICIRVFSSLPIFFFAFNEKRIYYWLMWSCIYSAAGAVLFGLFYGPT